MTVTYYFYIITSFIGDVYITIKNNLIWSFYDIWRPLVIFPLIFSICVIIHTIIISLISVFADIKKNRNNPNNMFRSVTLETINLFLHIVRARVHVNGKELLPQDNRKFLLVGNHRSIFDPMIAMLELEDNDVAFVSKKENIEIPFGGRLMLASGCVPLDRENNRSAVKSIREAASLISENAYSMGIYPEGGINKSDDILLPFHSGSFKIAKKTNAPIVIAAIRNSEQLCKSFLFTSTDVYFDILRVINPEEYSSMTTKEISEIVRNEIYAHLRNKYIAHTNASNTEHEAAC